LLAADHDGVIPASPVIIKKLCHMDTEPDIELFVTLGFIEHDASMASGGRQPGAKVTPQSRIEESRGEENQTRARARPLTTLPPDLVAVADELPNLDTLNGPTVRQLTMLVGKARGAGTTLKAACERLQIATLSGIHVDELLRDLRPAGNGDPKRAEAEAARAKSAARRKLEADCRQMFAAEGEDAVRAWIERQPASLRTSLGIEVDGLVAEAMRS